MDYGKLVTTIVAGVMGSVMAVCITVLLASGVSVPDEFLPALLMLIGAAVGSARAAS